MEKDSSVRVIIKVPKSNEMPEQQVPGRIVGMAQIWGPEGKHNMFVVELERVQYTEDKKLFISQVVVDFDNLTPPGDSDATDITGLLAGLGGDTV